MEPRVNELAETVRRENLRPTISAVLDDGTIIETCYSQDRTETSFAVWRDGSWTIEPSVTTVAGERLVPYSPRNNLLVNEVVLFPSEPEEYVSDVALLGEIQSFVHRYVDVSPLFEKVASYYVLLSWVYDAFDALPYLRLRGDPGSGKTRFLLTVGSLCYKPIFASGASTVSPLFRMLDTFRGTLIIDEADFRLSDERAEIVKILNNGNARGFPVLRSEVTPKKEFNPTAFAVFGPKIVATRSYFEDRALESRCLTEEMGLSGLREDVPISLPASFKEEALGLRNKLLFFRFRNLKRPVRTEDLVDRTIEPRLSQIFVPLMSIIPDAKMRDDLRGLARQYHRDLIADRGMETEAQVLEILQDLLAAGERRLSIKDVTSWFTDRFGEEYERKVTTKWIGYLVRKRLRLKTHKSHGAYVIPTLEIPKLHRLFEKYGVRTAEVDFTGSVTEDVRTLPSLGSG